MDLRIVALCLLTWASVVSANKPGHILRGNYWQTLAPGELLNELDSLATDELQNRRYLKPLTVAERESTTVTPLRKTRTTKKSTPKKKHQKSRPNRRYTNTENDSAASTSASAEQEDYDRAYEEFVNRYFNDAADHYLADDASVGQDASNLSGSIEADIIAPLDAQPFGTSPKATKREKKKNCRKTRKNGESCLICKNPRTNEQSETCSYEHSSEPETYAYDKQRTFRKSRDRNSDKDDDANNVGAENDSSEFVAESKLLAQTVPPFVGLNKTSSAVLSSNSACIKRTAGDKTCYYCRNTLGELQVNCSVSEPTELEIISKKKPIDENSHKKRRIFKRTLSYVFEKGHDSNGTFDLSSELPQNSTDSLN